jgi:hypothetical protein
VATFYYIKPINFSAENQKGRTILFFISLVHFQI